MTVAIRRLLAQGAPFSYTCAGCGRCCHDKRITLTPYEIARLAEARGTTTTEILARHTDEAGTVLRFVSTGHDGPARCTFLADGACSAHGGRPLACRLYPLGRIVHDGREAFVELEPHPETEGTYGEEGDPAAWVEAQGAPPFLAWASRYHALFRRMAEVLAAREGGNAALRDALAPEEPRVEAWLDIDAVVAQVCGERGAPSPEDVDARAALHLDVLERWLATL